jgi:hypothetical protein
MVNEQQQNEPVSEKMMIDPRDFGRLEAEVKSLQSSNAALQTQIESLTRDVKELLALANQGRGGLWFGMAIASGVGGFATWAFDHILRR